MTRLIDADALEEHANDMIRYALYPVSKEYGRVLLRTVKNAPTIDAVPVIRCKDCKYWSAEIEQTAVPNMHKCTWWRNIGTFPTDFCSRAERRGEE